MLHMSMPMPMPSAGDLALDCLVGTWRGTERMHPVPFAPQGGTVEGTVHNVRALDGFAVVQDYTQSRAGTVTFRGHGVFRFDQASGEHHLHWFDSIGQGGILYRGAMKDRRMTLEYIWPAFAARAAWDLTGDGTILYSMDIRCDADPWQRFIDCEYRRVADCSPRIHS